MKKVFVFCIGGTGERVMKSITMLMAAGLDTYGYTVVPIIIDPHLDLIEKKNLQSLIENYREIHTMATVDGGVSKRRILFFYKQSPDFHKPGLCHVQKILYL